MRLLIILVLSVYVEASFAGSFTCRGHIIDDDTRQPVSKSTVREKCGRPAVQEFDKDIYDMHNGTKITVRYTSDNEVQSIEEIFD